MSRLQIFLDAYSGGFTFRTIDPDGVGREVRERNLARCVVFSIESEGLLRNMRNPGYFALCRAEECSDFFRIFRIRLSQIDQICHRFERIVDLMCDRGCHPARRGDLLSLEQGSLRSL